MANIIGRFESKYVQPRVVEAPRMTFQTFYKKYIEPGNSAVGGVKYEYCNGFVEQTTTMSPKKLFLVQHLTGLFYRMKQETGGTIVNELETWTSEVSWRKPDWAYVTDAQINSGRADDAIVPEFMVEMLSKNDDILVVQKKIYEYFRIGVRVLWIIYPQLRVVHVYTSTKRITVCEDDTDICSAAPVLPEFEISIYDLFKI